MLTPCEDKAMTVDEPERTEPGTTGGERAMLEEYARDLGHAGLLREQADGATGE